MTRLLATAMVLAFVPGCVGLGGQGRVTGTGDVARTQRAVGPFHRIEVDGTADLHINAGQHQSLTIEAQPNIADLFKTTVTDGTLRVSQKERYTTDKTVLVTVGVPTLDGLSIRGGANATISGVQGPQIALSIAGAGNVDAAGSAERLTLECSGAGNADLVNLKARDAVVRLGGVGNARLNVSTTLDVEINGVGSVTYRGSPRIVHQVIRGVGNLSRE